MQREPHLVDRERHEEQRHERNADPLITTREIPEAPLRRDAQKRERDDEVQPRPARRIRLVERDDERDERDATRERPEQAPRRDRDDQHDEDVEQPPALEPRAVRTIRARRSDEPVPRRRMQRRIHVVEGLAITRHRRRTVPSEPRRRSQVDVCSAQLDALQIGLRALRDEQVVVVDGSHRHDVGSAHIETPAARHAAADAIARRKSAAVEVEP